MAIYKIPDNMRVGPPVLRVRNLTQPMAFYENSLGLQVNRSYKADRHGGNYYDDDVVVNPIYEEYVLRNTTSILLPLRATLILKHNPNARKMVLHSAGLYHFAILVPDRKSLASTYLAVKNSGVRYDGFADHLVSESLYLRDPEDNGIEIYRDRQAIEWPREH